MNFNFNLKVVNILVDISGMSDEVHAQILQSVLKL